LGRSARARARTTKRATSTAPLAVRIVVEGDIRVIEIEVGAHTEAMRASLDKRRVLRQHGTVLEPRRDRW
jgi:hypothetical protein